MWEKVDLPYITERFMGFSLPVEDVVALISFDDISLLDLKNTLKVVTDESLPMGGELFDEEKGIFFYNGKTYSILGLYGGNPIQKSIDGKKLYIDYKKEVFWIKNQRDEVELKFEFEDMSGDWVVGSFSEDGNYAFLCMPYDFYVFRKV